MKESSIISRNYRRNHLEHSRFKRILRSLGRDRPQTAKGYNLEQDINNRLGPLIEIAGPTARGYALVDFSRVDKELLVTNVISDEPEVDCLADATHLPFRDNSVGTIFVSGIPKVFRPKAIPEIQRVLEPNGLVIWQGGTTSDILSCLSASFTLVSKMIDHHLPYYTFALRKHTQPFDKPLDKH